MNIKIAKTEHPVIDLIKNRWSPRSFKNQAISEEDLQTLFEAASWTFSANNEQPWEFIYAHKEDNEAFKKLHDCLMPGNKPWAENAAVLMVICAHKKMQNGKENKAARFDVGASSSTMLIQATAMGIYGHIMGGFEADKAVVNLNIDTEMLEPVVFMALGYLDSPEKLDEPFKTREITPRSRKALNEIIKRLQ